MRPPQTNSRSRALGNSDQQRRHEDWRPLEPAVTHDEEDGSMFERDDAVPPDLAKVPVPRHALEVIPIFVHEREDVGRSHCANGNMRNGRIIAVEANPDTFVRIGMRTHLDSFFTGTTSESKRSMIVEFLSASIWARRNHSTRVRRPNSSGSCGCSYLTEPSGLGRPLRH